MTTPNQYLKIVPFIFFVLALILAFKLIQPMITILLSSMLLAYISFPIYRRVMNKLQHKSISIIIALLVVVVIILIPFLFLAFEITQQGYYFYNSLSGEITKGALFGFGCTSADSKVCLLVNQAERFSVERLSAFGFDKQLQKLLPLLEEKITTFILSIPIMIAKIFLIIVIAYFILKEWRIILEKVVNLIPIRKNTMDRLIHEFGDITYTVVYAQLFVACIQGIVGMIGLYFFGVPFPVFLGVVMAFCALIPTIGTAMIWVPASFYLIVGGYFSGDPILLTKGIFLMLYGIFVISIIDNVLLGTIVQAKARVSPIIVIIGVIGGASMFGIVGIFIGPILLPLLITYFETFKTGFKT